MDLERLFSASAHSPAEANDVFTDREAERGIFVEKIRSMPWEGPDPIESVCDPARARKNVLMYYGMGGVGKTTLSRQLQAMSSDIDPRFERWQVTCRLDFAELSAFDREIVLLRLRAAFGKSRVKFPAFDLALAAYWERKHPGEPLTEFLGRRSALGRLSADLDLADQVQSTLESLTGGLGIVSAAWNVGSMLRNGLVDRIRERRLLHDCPYLEPILEEPSPDTMRLFMPALLAWDLAKAQETRPVLAVAFMDTWERIQEQPAEFESLEDTINRAVFLMPNLLFVFTGRNRLDWDRESRSGALGYAGRRCWPTLEPEPGSSQYMLNGLSTIDSDSYLQERLTMNGRPAIPVAAREKIVAAAEGMPLYLELSVEHYDELLARGEQPDLDEFGTGLPQLVIRMTRDLSEPERSLLRAAALVRAFDRHLLREAVPGVGDAAIHRFLARAFVRGDRDGWLKHSIHDVLRQSVLEFDRETVDAWSPAEWRETAVRVMQYLRSVFVAVESTVYSAGRMKLSECFLQGALLADHFGFDSDWLVEIALALRDGSLWEPLELLTTMDRSGHPGFTPIRDACTAIYQRGRGQLSQAEDNLRHSLRHITCRTEIRALLELELAEILLRQNRDAEALELLDELADPSGACGSRPMAWRTVINERRSDFERAAEWTRLARLESADMQWFAINLHGHLLLASGRFREAAGEFQRSRFAAVQRGLTVDEIDSLQDEAWAAGFLAMDVASQLAEDAMSLSGIAVGAGSVARARSRLALTMLSRTNRSMIKRELHQSLAGLDDAGYHSDCADPLLVQCLLACVDRDEEYAMTSLQLLEDRLEKYGAHRHLSAVVRSWIRQAFPDRNDPEPDWSAVAWLDDEDWRSVRDRWNAVLDRFDPGTGERAGS